MKAMSRHKLLQHIDVERVRHTIEDAERKTSGEIRVSVAHFFWGSARHAAERAFVRLGMTRTAQRNAILFFVIPSRHQLVLLGDAGIHEKVGQEFWEIVVGIVTERFRAGEFTEGLVRGIEEVGRQLARHFPHDAGRDVNELPNEIETDNPE